MLITNEFLEQFKPCKEGLKLFNLLFPNGLDSRSVEDVRLVFHHEELCFGWAMVKFPEVFDSENVIYEILRHEGQLLEWVKIPITQRMVDIAINNTIHAFPWVPAEFQTEEMVYEALAYIGAYLKYVKIPITQKMVDIAMIYDIEAFLWVPAELQTEELRRKFKNAKEMRRLLKDVW